MDSLLPFLQGFFLPYNMSVYPGALRFTGHSPGTRVVSDLTHQSAIDPLYTPTDEISYESGEGCGLPEGD